MSGRRFVFWRSGHKSKSDTLCLTTWTLMVRSALRHEHNVVMRRWLSTKKTWKYNFSTHRLFILLFSADFFCRKTWSDRDRFLNVFPCGIHATALILYFYFDRMYHCFTSGVFITERWIFIAFEKKDWTCTETYMLRCYEYNVYWEIDRCKQTSSLHTFFFIFGSFSFVDIAWGGRGAPCADLQLSNTSPHWPFSVRSPVPFETNCR